MQALKADMCLFHRYVFVLISSTLMIMISSAASAAASASLEWRSGYQGSIGNLDGRAEKARFQGSLRIKRDSENSVFIIDNEAHTLRSMDYQGNVVTLSGRTAINGFKDGGNLAYTDVIRAHDGTIYVADGSNGSIHIVDVNRNVSTLVLKPAEQNKQLEDKPNPSNPQLQMVLPEKRGADSALAIAAPPRVDVSGNQKLLLPGVLSLAFDGYDRLWVNQLSGNVIIIERDGSVWPWMMSANDESIVNIASDNDGNIWAVTDKNTLVRLYYNGIETIASLSPYQALSGMSFDNAGNLYITHIGGLLRFSLTTKKVQSELTLHPDSAFTPRTFLSSVVVSDDGRILLAGDAAEIYQLQKKNRLSIFAGMAPVNWRNGILASSLFTPEAQSISDSSIYEYKRGIELREKAEAIFDSDGNQYFAIDAKIFKKDINQKTVLIAGSFSDEARKDGVGEQATFLVPVVLAVHKNDFLYLLDKQDDGSPELNHLRLINLKTGLVSTIARASDSTRFKPSPKMDQLQSIGWNPLWMNFSEIAIGANGDVYMLDVVGVWRINPATRGHTLFFVAAPEVEFRKALKQGSILTERDQSMIKCHTVWCTPTDIAIDERGYVYVSDSGNHTIVRIDPNGRKAGIVAGVPGLRGNRPGALPGALSSPQNLAWDEKGDLIISVDESGTMVLHNPSAAPIHIAIAPL
jgi:hypothetical protein